MKNISVYIALIFGLISFWFAGCGSGFSSSIMSFSALTEDDTVPVNDVQDLPPDEGFDPDDPDNGDDIIPTPTPTPDPSDGDDDDDGDDNDDGDDSGIDLGNYCKKGGRYFKLELLDASDYNFSYAIHTRLVHRVAPLTVAKPKRVIKDCRAKREPISSDDISAKPRPLANGESVCVQVQVFEGTQNNLKMIIDKKVCQKLK